MNTDPPVNGLTLQGGGLAKGGRQEALAVFKGDLQQQGSVQDRQSATWGRLPCSLWTDFQLENIQLAGEFNTSGTYFNYSHCPKNFWSSQVRDGFKSSIGYAGVLIDSQGEQKVSSSWARLKVLAEKICYPTWLLEMLAE